jgi:microcystin-dependent protein
MSQQYIAEIRAFGFNFAPVDWAQCNGQTMGIDQNPTLFNIIGTTYGGNGTTTFNLPNLQDRTPVGMGQGPGMMNWPLGLVYGEGAHTLLINEVPKHGHTANFAAGTAFTDELNSPTANCYPGRAQNGHAYLNAANSTLASAAVSLVGGSTPHNNVQPVLVLNFCIALYGVYPPQS